MHRVEDVFTGAAELPAHERGAYLDAACAGDPGLRQRVEELLRCHDESNSLLLRPIGPADLGALSVEEKPSDQIGRYKLLEKIGEGGCGVVWMAEQTEPVRRRVALKIIRLGMDTREVVARFEAERQALALMDHPNIARVFDGGATAQGRPYFVMELVRGLPITRFCDEARLTPAQRLEVFLAVCLAVQHAHQKGVIHRDLKPSNVLVTVNDGTPVPKVIDFGVAKATQGPLTDKTLFTAFQQFIGTPVYMSPEQADLSSVDVDTRSDIYSLGVLLYELLTGAPPFDPKKLAAGGVDEIRRVLREVEPARPSARLATLDEPVRTTLSHQRSLAVHELTVALRGDLDWIVMRCLEKDRARRYASVSALIADLRRHLAHEPVMARPPSAGYRCRKFIRRHRLGVGAGLAIVGALLVGMAYSTSAYWREKRARERALAAEDAARRSEGLAQAGRVRTEEFLAFVFTGLAEQLSDFGQLPLLQQLSDRAVAYYESLPADLQSRESRAGHALALAGTGAFGWMPVSAVSLELGAAEVSSHRLQRALAIFAELESTGPLTPFMRVAFAAVSTVAADHYYMHLRVADAVAICGRGEQALQPALGDAQWGEWARRVLTKVIAWKALHLARQSRAGATAAIGELRRALALVDAAASPLSEFARSGLRAAQLNVFLAEALYLAGDSVEARAVRERAVEELRSHVAANPFLLVARQSLALAAQHLCWQAASEWRWEESNRARDEALSEYAHLLQVDPRNWKHHLKPAELYGAGGFGCRLLHDLRVGDFAGAEAAARQAIELMSVEWAPHKPVWFICLVRYRLAQLLAATGRNHEADLQVAAAEGGWQMQKTDQKPGDLPPDFRWAERQLLRASVERERLNWQTMQACAESVLAQLPPPADPGQKDGARAARQRQLAFFQVMTAAVERGDYARARLALAQQTTERLPQPRGNSLQERFERLSSELSRALVLARNGEAPAARALLAEVWLEVEAVFSASPDYLFNQVQHARALWIRAEVEPAAVATRRQWLETAARLLRPAKAAGRLTRYQREVLLRRIDEQLAALENGPP